MSLCLQAAQEQTVRPLTLRRVRQRVSSVRDIGEAIIFTVKISPLGTMTAATLIYIEVSFFTNLSSIGNFFQQVYLGRK